MKHILSHDEVKERLEKGERLLDIGKINERWSIPKQTIYNANNTGMIRYFKRGKKPLYFESDVIDWIVGSVELQSA